MRKHLYSVGSPKPASKGSVGAELVDGLMVKEEDYKLVKTRFSAFFGTHLHFFLQGAGIESLILTGIYFSVCVYLYLVVFCYKLTKLLSSMLSFLVWFSSNGLARLPVCRCSDSKLRKADCL